MRLLSRVFRPSTVFAALAIAAAQTPADAPETVIRINVNEVQVDAVVTDASGKPVTNLKPQDFVLLQDGKRQAITYFNYISTVPRAVGTPAPKVPAAKKTTQAGMPVPPPRMLKPAQIHRTIALVVDDLGLSFSSMSFVRKAMKNWVDKDMQPGDLVAVIRTGAGMGALQQFTADKRLLYAAIDHVKFNALGRVGVSSFEPLGSAPPDSPDTTSFDEWRTQIYSVGTLGAIRYVIDGLRELPGRKAVVLFSENLRLFYSDGPNDMVLDEVRRLEDAANRASAVIYSIDPRGLQYYGLTAADNTRGMRPDQIAQVPMQRAADVFNSQDGMVMLAHDTGGLFMHDRNDLDKALREAIADTNGYYLIGYHPDASTFDPKTGQPKFHRIAVRVKVPGLHVRSRSGFFGNSDRERAPVPRGREAEIASAMHSPFGASAIHVRLTPLFSQSAKLGSYLSTLLFIDGKDLKFSDEPDGWHKAEIEVVAMTFGENGVPVDPTDRTYTVRVRGQAFNQVREQGLVYAVSHPLKKPGPYQMRVVVRDSGTGQVGSASQFIEVPDVNKGHLTLSSLIVKEMPKAQPALAPRGPAQPPATPAQPAAAPAAPATSAAPGQPPPASGAPRDDPDGLPVHQPAPGQPTAASGAPRDDPGGLPVHQPAPGQPPPASGAPRDDPGGLPVHQPAPDQPPPAPGTPPAEHSEGQVAQENTNGSAAVRIFKPGTAILYGYQILNARAEGGKSPELEVQTHLFRDGQQVYEGKPMPIGVSGQTDLKRLLSGGSMRLGTKTPPGDYVLEVTVTDKLANDKYRTATQWMDFQVQ